MHQAQTTANFQVLVMTRVTKAMLLRYQSLRRFPIAFIQLTGLSLGEFEDLLKEIQPRYDESQCRRLSRPDRQRAIGGGDRMQLSVADQVLLTLVWRRHYPYQSVLGQCFGISQPTVWRCTQRIIPLLADVSCLPVCNPDPGRKQRQALAELLIRVPELVTLIGPPFKNDG